jgi:glycosyltransferase involved in cell wall biosynthesis
MRLAYLLKKFPRLSETFILTEVLAQEALRPDLHIFSRRAPDNEPRHSELAQLKARVEVFPERSAMDPWTLIFDQEAGGLNEAQWSRLRTLVPELSGLVGTRFSRLLGEALHLLRRVDELGIDRIHVHFATESAVVAMLARELGGPPYSITAHAKDIYRSAVRPELLDKLLIASAFTVTVCDANVEYLKEQISGAAASHVRRLYNGLALERFPYCSEGRRENHILAVGRLVEKKGFDLLIEALASARASGAPWTATIAGGGDQALNLQAQARAAGLDQQVLEFTGPVDQDAVRELMKSASVFCLPCIVGTDGNRDALPTVLLEALAMGLACVSTPVTGIPEILDHGRAGLLVPERDAVALESALAELLGDPHKRLEFARRGRARAEELFDARQAGRTLADWFSETCTANSA